jgi:hypothetical protein
MCVVRLRIAPTGDMRSQNTIAFREVAGILDTGAETTMTASPAIAGLMLRPLRGVRASGMHSQFRSYQAFAASLALRVASSDLTLPLRENRVLVSSEPLAGADALIGYDALAGGTLVIDYPKRTWTYSIP